MQRQPGAAGGKQRRCGNCKSPDAFGYSLPSGWAGFTGELPLSVATALRVPAKTQSLASFGCLHVGPHDPSTRIPLGAEVFRQGLTSAPSWPSFWSALKKTWSRSTMQRGRESPTP